MTDTRETHMHRIGYRTPDDVPEPDQPVLVDYVSGGRVAIVRAFNEDREPTFQDPEF